jgi:hypothetical protein
MLLAIIWYYAWTNSRQKAWKAALVNGTPMDGMSPKARFWSWQILLNFVILVAMVTA